MEDMSFERVLCVKNEVFVYRIGPRPSNRGYRASDWKLDSPNWTGRLRVIAVNENLFINLDDKTSGELYAQCPVEEYPSIAVESVLDSSRYFVIRIKDPSGKTAFVGIGFADRSDSFDLNVSLQEHFKGLRLEADAEKATVALSQGPKLDLGFKDGQTITLKLCNKPAGAKSRSKAGTEPSIISLLPPPPNLSTPSNVNPPYCSAQRSSPWTSAPSPGEFDISSGRTASSQANNSWAGSDNVDLLLDMNPAEHGLSTLQPVVTATSWGDFIGPSTSSSSNVSMTADQSWVKF